MRLFTRLVNEQDMLHKKDDIAAVTKAREDDLFGIRGSARGTRSVCIVSHQERFPWRY